MIEHLDRYLGPLRRRVSGMIGRAVISYVNDATKAQSLQLQLFADETQDGVERFQDYGFTSVPLPGAEAAVMFVGGTRSHGIVVACEDRRYRLKALQGGEVAIYDDLGQFVLLKRDRISISSPTKIEVLAPEIDLTATQKVIVDAPAIALGGDGGQAVARVGDTVSGDAIATGSTKVTAA